MKTKTFETDTWPLVQVSYTYYKENAFDYPNLFFITIIFKNREGLYFKVINSDKISAFVRYDRESAKTEFDCTSFCLVPSVRLEAIAKDSRHLSRIRSFFRIRSSLRIESDKSTRDENCVNPSLTKGQESTPPITW